MILGNLFVYPDKTALTPSCYTTNGHLLCYHVFYFYVEIPGPVINFVGYLYIEYTNWFTSLEQFIRLERLTLFAP